MSIIVCRPKSFALDMLANAERRALVINPANEAERRTIARTPVGRRGGQRRIAVVIGRKWPAKGVQLSVSFLDGAKSDLRKRILLHMNAWGQNANVKFAETSGVGQVRIARLELSRRHGRLLVVCRHRDSGGRRGSADHESRRLHDANIGS